MRWRLSVLIVLSLVVAGATAAGGAVARRAPARIVSTSPSITETLFALGLGDRVVGVSEDRRFPPQVVKLPKVGTFLAPDPELIAALRPDLVLIHALPSDLERQLSRMRLPFVVVDRGTVSSVWSSIRAIGEAAGVAAKAEALIADLQQQLGRLRDKSAARPRRTVLLLVGRRPGALSDMVAVGRDEYIDDLIDAAGGVNVMRGTGAPYPRVALETVIRLNPDVIIDTSDMGDTDAERARQGPANARLWARYAASLTAARTGRLFALTTDALVAPGPRVVEAAAWLASLIGGEGAQ